MDKLIIDRKDMKKAERETEEELWLWSDKEDFVKVLLRLKDIDVEFVGDYGGEI